MSCIHHNFMQFYIVGRVIDIINKPAFHESIQVHNNQDHDDEE